MGRTGLLSSLAVTCLLAVSQCCAGATYKDGDPVKVVANKARCPLASARTPFPSSARPFLNSIFYLTLKLQVGPYANPSETYSFYSLPYCQPESVKRESQALGDALSGDRRVNTMYAIKFKGETTAELLAGRTAVSPSHYNCL